jgi:hypothetical protein
MRKLGIALLIAASAIGVVDRKIVGRKLEYALRKTD